MPTDLTQYAVPAAAFLVGFLISFLILKSKNAQTASSLGKEIAELNDSLKNSEEELAHETNNLITSQKKIKELEGQKKNLETRLTTSEKEAEKIPQLEAERDESRKTENELQEKVNGFSAQLAELSQKQDESQKLSDEVEEQSGKIAELEATIAEYSNKITESDSIKEEQQALADELAAHKVKIAELEQTLRDTEEELGQTLQDYEAHLAESGQKQNQEDVAIEQDQTTSELNKIINEFSAKLAREIVQKEKL